MAPSQNSEEKARRTLPVWIMGKKPTSFTRFVSVAVVKWGYKSAWISVNIFRKKRDASYD